jgi:acetylornithine/succinyldiaminopimelate/putrescine aminotransferase
MALAAVESTLSAMATLPMHTLVDSIESSVRAVLGQLQTADATLRGRGALWCIELPDSTRAERVQAAVRAAGFLVTRVDRSVRMLPAATIEPALLRESCDTIARACALKLHAAAG